MAEDNKQQRPAQKTPDIRFTVEIGDDLNSNMIWPLDQRKLRGRWSVAAYRGEVRDERFSGMPDELPGLCFQVDVGRRIARIFDPLANQRNQWLRDQSQAACRAQFGVNFEPEKEVQYKEMSDDDIKSFLYWLRRFYDARQCVVRDGVIPEMRDILALPGGIFFQNFDQGSGVERLRAQPVKPYVPMRHEDEAAAPIVYAAN